MKMRLNIRFCFSGAVARDVKKAFVGLVLWNALTAGAEELKAVFEVWARMPVRRIGWRTVKAMLKCF